MCVCVVGMGVVGVGAVGAGVVGTAQMEVTTVDHAERRWLSLTLNPGSVTRKGLHQ